MADDYTLNARESTHDALLEEFGLLFKVINRSNDKNEIKRLSKKRDAVNEELNRIERATLNSARLPEEIIKAISELNSLTQDLIKEKKRIKKATEKIKEADQYIKQAKEVIKIASILF